MKYVLILLFSLDTENVWLIRKKKPEWQNGCLNGIGGKVEEGETPLEAAKRELKEEAGVEVDDLIDVGYMEGTNNDGTYFRVDVFTQITNEQLQTMEEEKVDLYRVEDYKKDIYIENVPMLIQACIYKINGTSNFKKLIMQY